MEHKHDIIISLNHQITCRTCGQIVPYFEEIISRVQSAKKAKRIMDEIAVAGEYKAISIYQGFVHYVRELDGLTEEITARETGDRAFEVVKITRMKEVIA